MIHVRHLESVPVVSEEYLPIPPRTQPPRKKDADQVLQELKDREREAVFQLVLDEDATHRSVASGDWNEPKVWATGKVPKDGDRVVIDANHHITITKSLDIIGLGPS